MVKHVICGDERQSGRCAQSGKAGEPPNIVAAVEVVGGEIGASSEIRRNAGGVMVIGG
jgi:hypothetical protein